MVLFMMEEVWSEVDRKGGGVISRQTRVLFLLVCRLCW